MKVSILILILLSVLSCGCQSTPVVIVNKPLYRAVGWEIWTAQPGDVIVYYYYTRPLSRIPDVVKDQLQGDFGEIFRQMDLEGSFKYFGFVIKAHGGAVSIWPDNSSILMTYVDHGDTLTIESERLFTIRKCDLQPVYSTENLLYIPSSADDIFETPSGNPVLFAKFPLTSQPASVLSCECLNTLSH